MLLEVAETDLWDNKLNRRRVVGIESFESSLIFFFKRYSRIGQWTIILCNILPIILKKVTPSCRLKFFLWKKIYITCLCQSLYLQIIEPKYKTLGISIISFPWIRSGSQPNKNHKINTRVNTRDYYNSF